MAKSRYIDNDLTFIEITEEAAPEEEIAIEETPKGKGGEGSGNFGHEGRPGEVGGSGGGGGGGESSSWAILQGSDKQNEWADNIRRTKTPQTDLQLRQQARSMGKTIEQTGGDKVISWMQNQSSSKWWIDNRAEPTISIVKQYIIAQRK